jgi:hypothetical protein
MATAARSKASARLFDPVEVDVDERHPAGMLVDEGEGGARDVAIAHARAAGDALNEGGLARAERADQADDVADRQGAPETLADLLQGGGGRGQEDEGDERRGHI